MHQILKQSALVAHNYHSANGFFPLARRNNINSLTGDQWGQFARLLPFLEQSAAFQSINFDVQVGTSQAHFTALSVPINVFRCPSDLDRLTDPTDSNTFVGWQHNNYKGNAGNDNGLTSTVNGTRTVYDFTQTPPAPITINETQLAENNNGVFVTGKNVTIGDIIDGTSNTALSGKAVIGDGDATVASRARRLVRDQRADGPRVALQPGPGSVHQEPRYRARGDVEDRHQHQQASYSGRTYAPGNYIASRYNQHQYAQRCQRPRAQWYRPQQHYCHERQCECHDGIEPSRGRSQSGLGRRLDSLHFQ